MDECLIIANEIMQKVKRVSDKSGIPVDTLLHVDVDVFLRKTNSEERAV